MIMHIYVRCTAKTKRYKIHTHKSGIGQDKNRLSIIIAMSYVWKMNFTTSWKDTKERLECMKRRWIFLQHLSRIFHSHTWMICTYGEIVKEWKNPPPPTLDHIKARDVFQFYSFLFVLSLKTLQLLKVKIQIKKWS